MSSGGYAVRKNTSGGGTVTSVGFTAPAGLFNVTGSPVTGAGTIRLGLNNFAQNLVFASSPTTPGLSPSMRALVAADIPDLSATYAALTAANNFTNDNIFSSTGYLQIPNGTTVQQPGSPANGMIRYNTTTGRFEFYNGAWINYVKLAGDTMTGDLSVPNVNVTTALKLMDTTQKIALDVPAATVLRIGGGFSSVLSPVPFYVAGIAGSSSTLNYSFGAAGAAGSNFGIYCNTVSATIGFVAGGATKITIGSTVTMLSTLSMGDNNISTGTATGLKLGTNITQKISFWNATPIVQPTTAITASTFVANTSGTLNDSATWDGYTIGQVVKALRNTGLLA